jgi:hypothetical protein
VIPWLSIRYLLFAIRLGWWTPSTPLAKTRAARRTHA